MPVTISGSTGIQNVLGSASAPAESNTTSSNTGLYFPTSTTLGLSTAGTNALYVDASQNVGIGTTSPGNKLSVASTSFCNVDVLPAAANNGGINIKPNGSFVVGLGTAGNYLGGGSVSDGIVYSNANLILGTNASERMRIDTSGNLLVGTTTSSLISGNTATEGTAIAFGSINSARSSLESLLLNKLGANGNIASFWKAGVFVGSISVTGTATAYNTSSDYRLKENVQPMTTGLAMIGALKPVTYDWISDKSEGEGFIAHELQAVIPHAVTGEKDAVDADGNPIHQGVDYSKIVVHLVAALQELDAKFEAYKAAHP